jgi:hypothetical protein
MISGSMTRLRGLFAFGGFLLFYVVGVFAREQYGIGISVTNQSSETIHQVHVKVERKGKPYELPDLEPGQTKRLFVEPVGESNVNLRFTDSRGQRHDEVLVGYVESGYCGNAKATTLPNGQISTKERINVAFCYGSWFEFFTMNRCLELGIRVPPGKFSKGVAA